MLSPSATALEDTLQEGTSRSWQGALGVWQEIREPASQGTPDVERTAAARRSFSFSGQGKGQGDAALMQSRSRFGSYFEGWIKSYSGRSSRGFSETTRPEASEAPMIAFAAAEDSSTSGPL
jgi:hypothetical protein